MQDQGRRGGGKGRQGMGGGDEDQGRKLVCGRAWKGRGRQVRRKTGEESVEG